jgi:hypothetical protein
MPKYYFHISNETEVFKDVEGFECPDLSAAHRYALQLIFKTMLYDPEAHDWCGWRISVTDSNGVRALTVLYPSVARIPQRSFGRRARSPQLKLLCFVALGGSLMAGTAVSQPVSGVLSCVEARSSFSCTASELNHGSIARILQLPSADDRDSEQSSSRHQRWLTRCRPVLLVDQYGVGRYRYAAAGCEFGRAAD